MNVKRIVAGCLAGTAVFTASALASPTASADDVVNGCPDGYFCLWEGELYSGELHVLNIAGDHFAVYEWDISSYWNRTAVVFCAYNGDATNTRIIATRERNDWLEPGWNDNIGGLARWIDEHGNTRC